MAIRETACKIQHYLLKIFQLLKKKKKTQSRDKCRETEPCVLTTTIKIPSSFSICHISNFSHKFLMICLFWTFAYFSQFWSFSFCQMVKTCICFNHSKYFILFFYNKISFNYNKLLFKYNKLLFHKHISLIKNAKNKHFFKYYDIGMTYKKMHDNFVNNNRINGIKN